ncbi:MAG TPA: lysophospholipid acyltransferase family protein [Kofleriaceae bacterium]|nr:lysophospholipid acyltransferase family protein [Kofleriaceae bacterium]
MRRSAHPAKTADAFARVVREAAFADAGYGYDQFGFHPPSLARAAELGAPIYERYFRVDSRGSDAIPASGPAIVVANHGGVLPVDAAMLCLDLVRNTEPPRVPRPVMDHFVPHLPFVSTWFARLGGVSGTRANVRALLARGELVVVWPEGVAGPAKRFRDRYRIQRWCVGFAELALRYHAPVIPCAVIGSEESWPLLGKLGKLHTFGIPYLPIAASPVPLPAHYHIRYAQPMWLDDHLAGADPDDPDVVANAATRVQVALEQLIDDTRCARRGVFR